MVKVLLISFLCICFLNAHGQVKPNCTIEVNVLIKGAQKGIENGKIQLEIQDDNGDERFKVFLLNQGIEKAKNEISSREVSNLKPGYYEFIIIDTKREKCFKELTVQVSEVN